MIRKMFRTSMALGLVVAAFLSLCVNAMAFDVGSSEKITYISYDESEDLISPQAQEVCAGLTYHKMMSSGWGTVYLKDGTKYISNGSAWQCKNCRLVMVTQGDIVNNQMTTIGKWATCPFTDKIANTGCVINPPKNYGKTSKNSMSGYKFFLS